MVVYPYNPSTQEAEDYKSEARLGDKHSKSLSQVSVQLLIPKWNIYHTISPVRLRGHHRRGGGEAVRARG